MNNPVQQIYENWSAFEQRKLNAGDDPNMFSCDEAWEIFYLKRKILTACPQLDKLAVLEAIESCGRNINLPLPRKEFVECVLRKLRLH